MNYKHVCGPVLSLLLLFALSVSVAAQRGRLRPPESLKCDRNNLTSFTGRVTSYSRKPGQIVIRMSTDENTKEHFVLRYSENESPVQLFLINAEPFGEGDWVKIESTESHLKPNMRATVWVCQGSKNPVIDWNPPASE
jgi:hypothetical protein